MFRLYIVISKILYIFDSKVIIMPTKRITIVAAMAFLLSSAVASADGPVFLFDQFVRGTFLTNDRAIVRTEVNIDINNGVVYYVYGENVMELTNTAEVDTLYAEGRKFVFRNDRVREILANWSETEPVCAGTRSTFTDEDLVGYWCCENEYNRVPHKIVHFIDGKRAAVYLETSSANLFHGIPGLEIPGFTGLFYCPQDNTELRYTVKDGIVKIYGGMTFKITRKGLLMLDCGGVYYKKFERRHFAEEIPPITPNYANPEPSSPIPVGGLYVSPEGYR